MKELPLDDEGNIHLPPGDNSLAGMMLEGRDFMFARLSFVDLTGADLYWGSLQECVLEGALLTRCDLRGAVLDRANLRGANLREADLGLDNLGGTTDFIGADLSEADLRNASIGGADFTAAIMIGVDLRGARNKSGPLAKACFVRANLTGANLGGADLVGATYDDATQFPRGFSPDKAGMVKKKSRKPRAP